MPTRPDFSEVERGDRLTADRVNKLGTISRSQGTPWPSSYGQGNEYASGNFPPTVIIPVEVIGETTSDSATALCDDGCDEDGDGSLSSAEQKLFCIRPRYYNPDDDEWVTDEDVPPFCLDPNAVDATIGIGDILSAYYDSQSGRFIPVISAGGGASIGFEIVEACCNECWADVIVQERPPGVASVIGEGGLGTETRCGSSSPKNLASCQLRVYDKTNSRCFLNEPNGDLVGRSGHAAYLTSTAVQSGRAARRTASCSITAAANCTSMPVTAWSIHSLCCAPDICAS